MNVGRFRPRILFSSTCGVVVAAVCFSSESRNGDCGGPSTFQDDDSVEYECSGACLTLLLLKDCLSTTCRPG